MKPVKSLIKHTYTARKVTKRVVTAIKITDMRQFSICDNVITITDNNFTESGFDVFQFADVSTLTFQDSDEAEHEFEIILDSVRNGDKFAMVSTLTEV